MTKTSGNFQSDFGAVVYDIYEPDSGANGANIIIQIAHGMVEHRGRFEWVARELAQNGATCGLNFSNSSLAFLKSPSCSTYSTSAKCESHSL